MLIKGPVSTARPQVANINTGRKVPPPAPATRPTRTSVAKPPPPPAPPSKQQAAAPVARPNLATNLAEMVFKSHSQSNILVEAT